MEFDVDDFHFLRKMHEILKFFEGCLYLDQ